MIIQNNFRGTQRENINHLKGEKDDDYKPIGNQFNKDDPFSRIKSQVDMSQIDPDDRGSEYQDESTWKDFY